MPFAPSELVLRPDGTLYHLGVGPDDVANKIIIVGDPDRVPEVSKHFDSIRLRKSGREFVIHTGELRGSGITVISSGIGVDNIDIVLNELDAAVNIDLERREVKPQLTSLEIVRIGTCGSLHDPIQVGSHIASAYAFGWDGVPWNYAIPPGLSEAGLETLLSASMPVEAYARPYAFACDRTLMDRVGKGMYEGITWTANSFYGGQGRRLRLPIEQPGARLALVESVEYQQLRILNYEMETSGLYALSAMLGHRALTTCVVLANRAGKEFHKDPSIAVESLVKSVLERF
ncbi:MAG: nucleoside phosphorylase [Flavobacteriales bacterium]|nr:nucleoside phosphorylase [Flavobacteriales bacterium]